MNIEQFFTLVTHRDSPHTCRICRQAFMPKEEKVKQNEDTPVYYHAKCFSENIPEMIKDLKAFKKQLDTLAKVG
jgi:hypothetical protein